MYVCTRLKQSQSTNRSTRPPRLFLSFPRRRRRRPEHVPIEIGSQIERTFPSLESSFINPRYEIRISTRRVISSSSTVVVLLCAAGGDDGSSIMRYRRSEQKLETRIEEVSSCDCVMMRAG
jgi:hypothetical protein